METEHVSEKNQLSEQLSISENTCKEKSIELEKTKEKLNQVYNFLYSNIQNAKIYFMLVSQFFRLFCSIPVQMFI